MFTLIKFILIAVVLLVITWFVPVIPFQQDVQCGVAPCPVISERITLKKILQR